MHKPNQGFGKRSAVGDYVHLVFIGLPPVRFTGRLQLELCQPHQARRYVPLYREQYLLARHGILLGRSALRRDG